MRGASQLAVGLGAASLPPAGELPLRPDYPLRRTHEHDVRPHHVRDRRGDARGGRSAAGRAGDYTNAPRIAVIGAGGFARSIFSSELVKAPDTSCGSAVRRDDAHRSPRHFRVSACRD